MADIEKLIAIRLPRETLAGFGPNPHESSEPIQDGRKHRPKTGRNQQTAQRSAKSSPQTLAKKLAARTVVGGQKSGTKKPGSRRSAKRDR